MRNAILFMNQNIVQGTLTLLLVASAMVTACSKTGSAATAVIRVAVGNQTNTNVDNLVITALTSLNSARHAEEMLSLAKQWGVPAVEADEKIHSAISVRKGKKPDLFVVEAPGLDHDIAVKIINNLCKYYCSLHPTVSLEGAPPAVINASVVQPAK
jgi:hypothetical protein